MHSCLTEGDTDENNTLAYFSPLQQAVRENHEPCMGTHPTYKNRKCLLLLKGYVDAWYVLDFLYLLRKKEAQ